MEGTSRAAKSAARKAADVSREELGQVRWAGAQAITKFGGLGAIITKFGGLGAIIIQFGGLGAIIQFGTTFTFTSPKNKQGGRSPALI